MVASGPHLLAETLSACLCRSTTAAMQRLGGSWKLVYTNHTATLMVLNAIRGIPLVDLGEVYQVIEPDTMQAYNKVRAAGDKTLESTVNLVAFVP
jgi:hypothetical protein